MKKLLLLIGLFLLSQPCSIVSASAGERMVMNPPIPVSVRENTDGQAYSAAPVPAGSVTPSSPEEDEVTDVSVSKTAAPLPVPSSNAIVPVMTPAQSPVENSASAGSETPAPDVIPASNEPETQNNSENFVPQTDYSDAGLASPARNFEYKNNIPQVISDSVSENEIGKPPIPYFVDQQTGGIFEEVEKPIEPIFEEVRTTITQVEFPESKIFTQEELQRLVEPLFGKPVSLEDIKKVVDGITRCYVLGDYTTSRAYLPPQTIEDGILKIGLIEGTVGKVTVEDNVHTRTTYITSRVPIQEGSVVQLGKLQKDVIKFNNLNTAKLKIELYAGENQGETDIVLKTEEPFPFKVSVMTDNAGRESTGKNRVGAMVTYDSVLGLRDKLTLGGYLGKGTRIGFADYNIPISKYGTRFGVSVSANNIDVVKGPMRAWGIGGKSQVYSAYLTHPIVNNPDFNLNSYTSANIKHSSTDITGVKILENDTFSVTQGFTARKDTKRGIWYTGHFGSAGFKAFSGDDEFLKYEGNLTRLHDFGHGILGEFRIAGQYSPDKNLPWMEQFQLGGISTVRGYSEALLLGKSGYFASAEILTPLPFLPRKIGSERLGYIRPRDMIKGAVFMDNGMVFPYKYGEAVDSGDFLMSWGVGLRMQLSQNLGARFYWGFGLNNRYEYDQQAGRFHFEITCTPDIGTILSQRKFKENYKIEDDL